MTLAAFLVLASSAATRAGAGEPLKPFVDCVVATRDCSRGTAAAFKAGVVGMALIPAAREGHDGFYVFAPEDAYFHAFPAPPPPVVAKKPPPPSFWNLYGVLTNLLHPPQPEPNPYFNYKIEAGIHEPVYVSFKWGADGAASLTQVSTTAGPSGTVYLPGGGGECHADEGSVSLIKQDAFARVRSVWSTYLSSPEPDKSDVSNEYNVAGHDPVRTFFNREQCLKSLDGCVDDAELKTATEEERAKFNKK